LRRNLRLNLLEEDWARLIVRIQQSLYKLSFKLLLKYIAQFHFWELEGDIPEQARTRNLGTPQTSLVCSLSRCLSHSIYWLIVYCKLTRFAEFNCWWIIAPQVFDKTLVSEFFIFFQNSNFGEYSPLISKLIHNNRIPSSINFYIVISPTLLEIAYYLLTSWF
jgi:hypothetical protein